MRTLIVGAGALGGVIAARLRASGSPVSVATRNAASAAELKAAGLHVTGVGGEVVAEADEIAPVDEYCKHDPFDLILLATKAQDAVDVAPRLAPLLAPGGTLLPIQNGVVSEMLADQLGHGFVLGGLSNLGATMTSPGVYAQRNAGHLLVGEVGGGRSARADRISQHLGRAIEVRVTANLRGALWSKLILNCSVTTIAAVAGRTMREYARSADGRMLFRWTYDEALAVAAASGVRLERMIVDPVPAQPYDRWLEQVIEGYGDLKPSMLQDFERERRTEIDYINGYVVERGREIGVPTPLNAALADTVRAISAHELRPHPAHLRRILQARGKGRAPESEA